MLCEVRMVSCASIRFSKDETLFKKSCSTRSYSLVELNEDLKNLKSGIFARYEGKIDSF